MKNEPDDIRTFQYTAIGPTGNRVSRRMSAPSAAAVSSALFAEGFTPTDVHEISAGGLNLDLGAALGAGKPRMSIVQLSAFSSQLHQLLAAGLSVPRSLRALAEEQKPNIAAACVDMAERVAAGTPLAEAFAEYPSLFDEVFVSYIDSGERTGELPAATARLSRMLEKRAGLNLKIKSVTAYPKMVASAVGVMVVGIIAFMVPKYAEMYAGFGAPLPGPTQSLIDISNSLVPITTVKLGPVSLPVPNLKSVIFWIVSLWGSFFWWRRRTAEDLEVGRTLDRIRYKMPVFGKLNAKMMIYRWTSTLSGALASGLQLPSALTLAARASGSQWQMWALPILRDAVQAGRPLSGALNDNRDLYPAAVRAMVATGEEAGTVDAMLDSASRATDAEIDSIVAGLGAKIEVALLLVKGIVVGGILVILYLPILQLATTVGSGLSGGEF